MSNIPLFHEISSELFLALVSLANDICDGQRLSREDVISRFPHIDWVNMDKINHPVKNLLTDAHLAWLKSMLLDPECDFILSNELRLKLLTNLLDTEPLISRNAIDIVREQGDKLLQAESSAKLSTICQALYEHRMVSYRYQDRTGNLYKGVAAPCRLEYDCAQHRLRLILWLQAEKRAIKLNVNNLQQISLSDISYGEEIEN